MNGYMKVSDASVKCGISNRRIVVDNRERYIKNKLIATCEQISASLIKFLKSRVDCLEKHEKELLKDLVIDLQELKTIESPARKNMQMKL